MDIVYVYIATVYDVEYSSVTSYVAIFHDFVLCSHTIMNNKRYLYIVNQ